MKTYKKRCLIVVIILTTMSFNIQACNNVDKPVLQNTENTTIEKTETNDTDEIKSETNNQTESETSSNSESGFDASKTITENIDILNSILETKFGECFSLSTIEDYEKAGQSDWTLILGDSKVGIDTDTWKYGYDSDSDESKYMDAILITFIFFYGEEMGNSLWLLTGDLLDGGADESLYGFTHDGGQTIYKNGNIAIYEPGNNGNFYIWLTPEGLK